MTRTQAAFRVPFTTAACDPISQAQRDDVVELLRCAADCAAQVLALLPFTDARERLGYERDHEIASLAATARSYVQMTKRGALVQLLEAAQRVEDCRIFAPSEVTVIYSQIAPDLLHTLTELRQRRQIAETPREQQELRL